MCHSQNLREMWTDRDTCTRAALAHIPARMLRQMFLRMPVHMPAQMSKHTHLTRGTCQCVWRHTVAEVYIVWIHATHARHSRAFFARCQILHTNLFITINIALPFPLLRSFFNQYCPTISPFPSSLEGLLCVLLAYSPQLLSECVACAPACV